MEFFDFDQAGQDPGMPSSCFDILAQDLEPLSVDETRTVPFNDPPIHSIPTDATSHNLSGPWPMHRAPEACFFCHSMGLDCFVAQRGVLQNGCTCCISLYRECSFTNAKPREKVLETLHVVGEDSCVTTGSLTGSRALKSYRAPFAGTLLEETEQRGRKSGSRFPKEAVTVLKAWLSQNTNHPYPTEEEKDQLKAKTGLRRSQISNWLANARRRGKTRPELRSEPAHSSGVPIPGKRLPPGVALADLNPLERWKHSPPENEAASARDILQAMATTSFNPHEPDDEPHALAPSASRRDGSSNDDSSLSNIRPPRSLSGYSLDTTQSSISDMSFASAFSQRSSRASLGSMEARDRRRRRHKSALGQHALQKPRAARIYQCTFCTDSFPTKYDWQRHEKSLHLALDKWACAPQGGVILENGESMCAFCRHPNPNDEHLETHNYTTCQEKPIQERTFYRKDHLNQHLRLMHNVKLGPWMDGWKSATIEVKSRCGFCSASFTTWKDRVDHLAIHFKAGAEMSQWKGDWGFEPSIQKRVENAMPPYLIGEERNTMDPWVAHPLNQGPSKSAVAPTSNASINIPVPGDASCFRRLEVELSAFIGRMTAQGMIPTDAMLQAEARNIIYGSDDPWNQTCADNPTWLAILKRDAGIYNLPGSGSIQLDDLGMRPPFAANGGLRRPPTHSFERTSAGNSPGPQSPAIPGSGVHSSMVSHRGSLAGSLAGSADFSTPGFSHGGSLPRSALNSAHSSSVPNTMENDPIIRMGFDADFVRRLDEDYGSVGVGLEYSPIDRLGSGSGPGTPAFPEHFGGHSVDGNSTPAITQNHATNNDIAYHNTFDPQRAPGSGASGF